MSGYGEVYGCRITNYYYDPEPYTLFAYLRLALCNQTELSLLEGISSRGRSSIIDYCKQPLGLWTELRVLKVLAEMSQYYYKYIYRRRLQLYPSNIEEDLKLLASNSLPPFSNHRHAVIMVKGEKVIFNFYIELYEKVKELLCKEHEEAIEVFIYIYIVYL